jgi:hypothetical protein
VAKRSSLRFNRCVSRKNNGLAVRGLFEELRAAPKGRQPL